MRMVKPVTLGVLAALLGAGSALASTEAHEPPKVAWSFNGPFGTYDRAAVQRGFQVYNEVCSNCHSMNLLSYRNLTGIGLSEEQVKAIAATKQIGGDTDDAGQPIERAGLPSDKFKSPHPNDKAARAANGGALPPDQSLIINAREDGPELRPRASHGLRRSRQPVPSRRRPASITISISPAT